VYAAKKADNRDALGNPEALDQIRDRFKSDAPGAPGCAEYAEELVAGMLAESVGADADPSAVLEQVLAGVVKGANAAGAPLWLAARGAMLGALKALGLRAEASAIAPYGIRVDEPDAQRFGNATADARLSRPHGADQNERASGSHRR